jgi:hypothetical protein
MLEMIHLISAERNRPMRCTLLLLSNLLLAGCGEAERPRFTPATDDAPAVSTSDQTPDRLDRGRAMPKNIPMH